MRRIDTDQIRADLPHPYDPRPILKEMNKLIIAIDGPSGSGKSSIGKAVARRLDYLYIDSGAVYRAVGLKALNVGASLEDGPALGTIARAVIINLQGDPDHQRVLMDDVDVSSEIRLPKASRASSIVATIPEVRDAVVRMLRDMSREGGVVMDGRDIGTKVFPNAQVKLFLDASLDVRARRRREEDRERGRDVSVEAVRAELEERDSRDTGRLATPLVKAPDAVLIDTSELPLEAVIERVLEIVNSRS